MGVTMMHNSLSHLQSPVYHLSTDRIAGLQFLLSYALSYHYARSWIVHLTRLLRHGGPGREVRGG
jgi:hypothetical protein